MKIFKNAAMALMLVFAFSCLKPPHSDSASEAGIESLIKKMLADPTYRGVFVEKDAINMVVNSDSLVESLFSNRYNTNDFFQNHLKALTPPEDFTRLLENVCLKFSNVHLIEDYMSDIYYPQNLNEDAVVADYSAKLLVVCPMKCVKLKKSSRKLLAFQVTKAYFYRSKSSGKFVGYTTNIRTGIPDFWFVLIEIQDGHKQSIKIWKK